MGAKHGAVAAILCHLTRSCLLPAALTVAPMSPNSPRWLNWSTHQPTLLPRLVCLLRRLATAGMKLLPKAALAARNACFMERLQHTVQQWEACPGSRAQLEHIIASRLSDRVGAGCLVRG